MTLVSKYSSSNRDVILGKMMSAPALKYRNKVFAFYYKKEMGFRLGPKFDPEKFGLKIAKPLSPFKTKPPLEGWFVIEAGDSRVWGILTEKALIYTMVLDK
jgi:hypothetical protein